MNTDEATLFFRMPFLQSELEHDLQHAVGDERETAVQVQERIDNNHFRDIHREAVNELEDRLDARIFGAGSMECQKITVDDRSELEEVVRQIGEEGTEGKVYFGPNGNYFVARDWSLEVDGEQYSIFSELPGHEPIFELFPDFLDA